MQKISIEIGGVKFLAVAQTEKAPKTCEALMKLSPISGEVMHARYAGEGMFFGLENPPTLDYENHTSYASKGDVLFYPGTIHAKGILIAYGAALFQSKVGLLAGNHFASITDGLDRLPEVGMRLLREGAKPILITPAD